MNIVFWLTTKLLDASHTEGRSKSTAGSRYRNDNPIALIDIAVGSVRQAPLLLMLLIRSVVMALAENLFNELHCRRYQLKVVLMERLKDQCFFGMDLFHDVCSNTNLFLFCYDSYWTRAHRAGIKCEL